MIITQLLNSALTSKKEKMVISVLCVWSFIHTYIIIKNNSGFGSFVGESGIRILLIDGKPEMTNPSDYFYPFYRGIYFWSSTIRYYDYTEYFFYVGGAWLIYFLYRFLKK